MVNPDVGYIIYGTLRVFVIFLQTEKEANSFRNVVLTQEAESKQEGKQMK